MPERRLSSLIVASISPLPTASFPITSGDIFRIARGLLVMKKNMKRKNAASLPELMESAKRAGVRLVACAMSGDLMGIQKEELIDGVEIGGVATYLDHAQSGNVNLFI